MQPHTRILYSLCDRITGEARGARQEDTGSNQARALHPTAQACAVGDPGSAGISRAEPLPGQERVANYHDTNPCVLRVVSNASCDAAFVRVENLLNLSRLLRLGQ